MTTPSATPAGADARAAIDAALIRMDEHIEVVRDVLTRMSTLAADIRRRMAALEGRPVAQDCEVEEGRRRICREYHHGMITEAKWAQMVMIDPALADVLRAMRQPLPEA